MTDATFAPEAALAPNRMTGKSVTAPRSGLWSPTWNWTSR